MTVTNACSICARLDPEAQPIEENGLLIGRCEAFPDGIPEDIWTGDHAHQVPFDDETLLFDPLEDEDPQVYVDLYRMVTGAEPDGLA